MIHFRALTSIALLLVLLSYHVIASDYLYGSGESSVMELGSEISDDVPRHFDEFISDDVPTVIVFYAPWCGHCQQFAPVFENVAESVIEMNFELKCGAVNCVVERDLCVENRIESYPSFLFFPNSNREEVVNLQHLSSKEDANEIVDILRQLTETRSPRVISKYDDVTDKEYLDDDNNGSVDEIIEDLSSGGSGGASDLIKSDILHDILLAAKMSLSSNIGPFSTSNEIELEDKTSLLRWLKVLSTQLPIRTVGNSIKSIYSRLKGPRKNNLKSIIPWNRQNWDSEIETIDFNPLHVPSDGTFKYCNDYNCGLWLLFHSLTISSYSDQIKSRDHITYDKDQYTSPNDVALAIWSYVNSFFNCAVCRSHFVESNPIELIDRLGQEGSTVVLWLWSVHNDVNARLRIDRSETGNKHEQFPSIESCPKCWRECAQNCESKVNWNQDEVILYLANVYSLRVVPISKPQSKMYNLRYLIVVSFIGSLAYFGNKFKLLLSKIVSLNIFSFKAKANGYMNVHSSKSND